MKKSFIFILLSLTGILVVVLLIGQKQLFAAQVAGIYIEVLSNPELLQDGPLTLSVLL